MNNVKLMGADASITNHDDSIGGWNDVFQYVDAKCKVFKISISPLAGMAAAVYVWVFDLAAGTTTSTTPVIVRYVPAGYADTWDFGPDGSLFTNGVFMTVCTAAPTAEDTSPLAILAGQDKTIIKLDYRKL